MLMDLLKEASPWVWGSLLILALLVFGGYRLSKISVPGGWAFEFAPKREPGPGELPRNYDTRLVTTDATVAWSIARNGLNGSIVPSSSRSALEIVISRHGRETYYRPDTPYVAGTSDHQHTLIYNSLSETLEVGRDGRARRYQIGMTYQGDAPLCLLDITPGKKTSRKFWDGRVVTDRTAHLAFIDVPTFQVITQRSVECSFAVDIKAWVNRIYEGLSPRYMADIKKQLLEERKLCIKLYRVFYRVICRFIEWKKAQLFVQPTFAVAASEWRTERDKSPPSEGNLGLFQIVEQFRPSIPVELMTAQEQQSSERLIQMFYNVCDASRRLKKPSPDALQLTDESKQDENCKRLLNEYFGVST